MCVYAGPPSSKVPVHGKLGAWGGGGVHGGFQGRGAGTPLWSVDWWVEVMTLLLCTCYLAHPWKAMYVGRMGMCLPLCGGRKTEYGVHPLLLPYLKSDAVVVSYLVSTTNNPCLQYAAASPAHLFSCRHYRLDPRLDSSHHPCWPPSLRGPSWVSSICTSQSTAQVEEGV